MQIRKQQPVVTNASLETEAVTEVPCNSNLQSTAGLVPTILWQLQSPAKIIHLQIQRCSMT
jgi:hypothetical protein